MWNEDWRNEKKILFFLFKQKTASGIRLSLVGSVMFIRDRLRCWKRVDVVFARVGVVSGWVAKWVVEGGGRLL